MYRKRFGLRHPPLPRNAQNATFFTETAAYKDAHRSFTQLLDEGGLGVVTGQPGVGKTAALRNLCGAVPQPDHRVVYLCDTTVPPAELYRTLASELGVRPAHRRGQLWRDLKERLLHLVDEQGTVPIVVIDEAQGLSDDFLADLVGFLNFAFDSRDLFPLWLISTPALRMRLRLQHHAALAMRVASWVVFEPLERDEFVAMIAHGLRAAGAKDKLLSDPAMELLFRTSRGLPRLASRLLRTSLRVAHERDASFVDEHVLEAAAERLAPGVVS